MVDYYYEIRKGVIWSEAEAMAVAAAVMLGIAFGVAFGTTKSRPRQTGPSG
jgi:hypothetical protein